MTSYWLREDERHRRYVLHKDSCFRVKREDDWSTETYDWEPFDTLEEAMQYAADGEAGYELHRCRNCFSAELRKEFQEKYRKKAK